jgi:hypothetical protein
VFVENTIYLIVYIERSLQPDADQVMPISTYKCLDLAPVSLNEEENQLDFVTQSEEEMKEVLKLCKHDSGHLVSQLETPELINVTSAPDEDTMPRDYYFSLSIHMEFMIQTVKQEKKEKEAEVKAA